MFSGEVCEISKSNFFIEHLRTTASVDAVQFCLISLLCSMNFFSGFSFQYSHPSPGNNRKTRTRCEIWSKLTIKIPERRHWLEQRQLFTKKDTNSYQGYFWGNNPEKSQHFCQPISCHFRCTKNEIFH